MGERTLVIVKEAQQLKIEALDSYLDRVQETYMVLCYKYKTLDKRKSFTKNLAKKAVLFDSKTV